MSFYHILPSDTAKSRFPHNCAAQFSIPVDDNQQLSGAWEVGLAQLAYSNCLYTFDHETITIKERHVHASQCDTGCRVYIPKWPTTDRKSVNKFIADFLNIALKDILFMTPTDETYNKFNRKVQEGWIIAFSWKLKQELGLMENAMTSYDNYPYQYYVNTHDAPYIENAFYVDIIPTNEDTLVKKIVLK